MSPLSNLIFDTEPVTWQELEDMVCRAFDEKGYESSRKAILLTARWKVEIDVHAVKPSNPIPTLILCECKYWNKRIDQNVIFSFRSICSDVGAHYGLIISKEGFQSGAAKSREHTNIHLLNFIEFQKTFFHEWMNGVAMTLLRMSDPLIPKIPLIFVKEWKFASIIVDKYAALFGGNGDVVEVLKRGKFPVKIADPRGDPYTVSHHIVVRSPRQYFDIVKKGCEDARRHFCI